MKRSGWPRIIGRLFSSGILAALLAATIFAIDLMVPLGAAAGVPYVAVMLLCATASGRVTLAGAAGSSVLTLLGMWLSPPGGITWQVLTNRVLAIFAIWVVTALFWWQRQAAAALRLQSEIAANLAEGVHLARVSDTVLVYANRKMEQMLGYDHGELIGQPVSVLNAPTDRSPEEIAAKIIATLTMNGTWEGDIENIRKDGTPIWCHATVATFEHPEHGEVWITVHTNISASKQAEKELRRSEERFRDLAAENELLLQQERQSSATKSLLLDEINHRVKNNLASIIGLLYAERRHRGTGREDNDVAARLVRRIEGLATAHRLLSAAEWGSVSLAQLNEEVIASALEAMPQRRSVAVEIAPTEVMVTAAQAHDLALIINELATNSVKHANSGAPASIAVEVADEGDTVLMEFRDDGLGYPEDVLRAERSGVGLYLVRTLVTKALSGELMLSNRGGAVTRIRFENLKAEKEHARGSASTDRRG